MTSNGYIVVLRKDLPSPLAPLSDEEGEAKTEAAKTGSAEKEKEKPAVVVKVDFERIGQRILAMPIPARNYTELKTGKEGVLFLVEGPLVAPLNGPDTLTAHRFELKTRKTDKLLENISGFLRFRRRRRRCCTGTASGSQPGGAAAAQVWAIAAGSACTIAAGAPAGGGSSGGAPTGAKTLNLAAMDVRIEPMVEWKEMYHEAFRLERDFFYDGGFHGLDLAATEKKFAAYLPGSRVARRFELHLRGNDG